MAIINTTVSSNETQLENGLQTVYITWYVLAGSTGLIGNTFVLVVFYLAKRLQPAKLVVSWLAVVDLFGCLTIPLRYLILFQADKLPKPLCIAIPPILFFSASLTLFSLVVAAIERYRAVRFVNNLQNDKTENTILLAMIAFSVLLALVFGAMSRFQVQLDEYEDDIFYCTSVSHQSFHDSPDVMENIARSLAVLIIFGCIVLITALYIKIALLLRRRIAIGLPNTQRQPNCSTAVSAEQNSIDDDSEGSDERFDGIYELCENPNFELKEVADVGEIEPEIVSNVRTAMTKNQENKQCTSCSKIEIGAPTSSGSKSPVRSLDVVAPPKASGMVFPHAPVFSSARNNANLSVSRDNEEVSAVATTSNQNAKLASLQLPGAVFGDDENASATNSPSIRPRCMSVVSSGKDEPAIPTLEENTNHKSGLQVITKTTLMLFVATVMCFVTYGFVGIFVTLSESSKAGDFVLEFLLIIHVINPIVYNFVNEGFRDDCRDFFKKIKLRCFIQRESSLAENHQEQQ